MKKKQIRSIDKQIKSLSKLLKKTEKELKWARTLPEDPSIGADLSEWYPLDPDTKNENPHLKMDYLESYQYTIGFCTGSISILEQSKYYLTVNKKQYKLDEIKDKKITKQNRKEMNRVAKQLKL